MVVIMRLLLSILLLAFTLSVNASAADRRRTVTQQKPYPEMIISGCVIVVDERALQYTSTLTRWKNYGSAGSASDFIGAVNPPAVSTNLNGLPVVSFDGVNDYMTNSHATIAQPYTVVCVFKYSSGTWIISSVPGSTASGMLVSAGEYDFYGANGTISISKSINTAWHIAIYNPSLSGGSYIFDNSSDTAWDTSPNSAVLIGLTLCARYNITGYAKTDIATILVFNRALSTYEKAWLQSYLIAKYGLTFAANIPRLEFPDKGWQLANQFRWQRPKVEWQKHFAM
jgi:hypothetical protein